MKGTDLRMWIYKLGNSRLQLHAWLTSRFLEREKFSQHRLPCATMKSASLAAWNVQLFASLCYHRRSTTTMTLPVPEQLSCASLFSISCLDCWMTQKWSRKRSAFSASMLRLSIHLRVSRTMTKGGLLLNSTICSRVQEVRFWRLWALYYHLWTTIQTLVQFSAPSWPWPQLMPEQVRSTIARRAAHCGASLLEVKLDKDILASPTDIIGAFKIALQGGTITN